MDLRCVVVLWTIWTYKIDAGRPPPIQPNAAQFSSIQFNSLQLNSIQFNSIQFNSIAHLVLTFFLELENPEQISSESQVQDV